MTAVRTFSSTAATPRRWRLIMVVAALGAAELGSVSVAAQPLAAAPDSAPRELRYEPAEDGFIITIRGDVGAPAGVLQEGRDLFLSFAKVAPAFDAPDLQRRAAAWLEGVSVGYDSLLLRLAPGVGVRIEAKDAILILTLSLGAGAATSADAPKVGPHATDGTGALRLELLRAQLLLREQELSLARSRFAALRAAMPGRPEPLIGLASVERQVGHWRRSLELYREAVTVGGDTADLAAALREIEDAQASRASVDVERRTSRGGSLDAPVTLTLGQAKGFQRVEEAWRVGVDANTVEVRTATVRRMSGALESFSGSRNRADLSVQHDHIDGSVTIGALFLGSGNAGLGLQRRQPDDAGSTGFVAEWHRPSWAYVEGLIDGALRDRVSIFRIQRLRAELNGRIEFGFNRYHQRDDGELGRSTSFAAELRLDRLAGLPGLAAVYAVDGEYIDRRSARQTPSGETFAPLPLLNREVHSVTIGYTRNKGDRLAGGLVSFDGYAGFGSDRYGRSGPIAAATLGYASGALELQLRGSHVRNVGRSRGSTSAVGGFVSIIF